MAVTTTPGLYRTAVYAKRTGKETLGDPPPSLGAALKDAERIAATHPAKVILVLKSDKFAVNAGKFFLCRIINNL